MVTYLVLLRGINVGGKNKIRMAELKQALEESGCENVITYIQSGNVILRSNLGANDLAQQIEALLPARFALDDPIIKVLALPHARFQAMIAKKPPGFGDQPQVYHSDAIFLIGIDAAEVMAVFKPLPGVDQVWPGEGVIYSQRLSAQRTKSRLNRIIGTPAYQSMTIRSWGTVNKLLALMQEMEGEDTG